MSPNSRAQAEKTARGSWLAKGILPMRRCGFGPGGRPFVSLLITKNQSKLITKNQSNPSTARVGRTFLSDLPEVSLPQELQQIHPGACHHHGMARLKCV